MYFSFTENPIHDILLLTVTPSNKCIGIRIFSEPYDDQGNNINEYIDYHLGIANVLMDQIECGELIDFNEMPNIVTNIRNDLVNIDHVIQSHTECNYNEK